MKGVGWETDPHLFMIQAIILVVTIMMVILIFVSNKASNQGMLFQQLELEKEKLNISNLELEAEISSKSAINRIYDLAVGQGFVPISKTEVIK